jgi:hypothetical protein
MMKKLENDPESIIFIFIDGIGLGKKDIVYNPFTKHGGDFFSALGGKSSFQAPGMLIPTDTHMGLFTSPPQSGTGQVALFTGYNTIEIMNRHVAGFPPFSLRSLIKNESIIKKFMENNLKASVINTYTKKYLELITRPRTERFMSASTLMQIGSGQRLLSVDDLLNEKSIFMDITHWYLREQLEYDIPEIKPREAGRRLANIAKDYNLIIYEYFFADKYGHEGLDLESSFIVHHLEGLLAGIWENLDKEKQLVILSSDHGNFEDLSIPIHTHNLVPTIVYGCGEENAEKYIKNIYDIPRFLMDLKKVKWENVNHRATEITEE